MLRLRYAEGATPRAGSKVNEWLDDSGEVLVQAFSREDLHWIEWRGVGTFAFSAGSQEVQVWPESGIRRETIVDIFDRTLQPILLQALGESQALHASAAVASAGVLAFCGRSGSGKSTLAFALQQVGCQQFADDALVLRLDGNRVIARPLPFMHRLRPQSRAHFERADELVSPKLDTADLPLAAVFLLQQDDSLVRARISLVPQLRAFTEVLSHAHCFDPADPEHTRRLAKDYLELTSRVPVFALTYPPDFRQLPQLIQTVAAAVANFKAGIVFPCAALG